MAANTSALRAEADALRARLSEFDDLDADALIARHPLDAQASLGYEPRSAVNLGLIQSSTLALDENERGLRPRVPRGTHTCAAVAEPA